MKKHNIKGFTVIELALTIVVVGIIVATVSPLLGEAFIGQVRGREIWDATWQGMIAQNRLSRDIQNVALTTTAASGQLTFNDAQNTSIDFQSTSSSLMRTEGTNTSRALADGVTTLTFTYWDKNNNTTSTLANVRCVEANILFTIGFATRTLDTTWCSRFVP